MSAGLQLAASSSGALRRASLYIGLLALGAFGPLVVLLLLWIGRLASDPAVLDALVADPTGYIAANPEVAGTIALLYVLLIVGLFLLVAISVDAQAMAVALLGGIAAGRPLRLWEVVTRARQTFWRLVGSGLIVGTVTSVVSFAIVLVFLRPFDSNQGLTLVASILGALAVTPFAFTAAGIVLGDVDAVEALRRSSQLFRARPSVAFVVVLFTLVTATIQSFALEAGLDAAIRVAEILDLGFDRGPLVLGGLTLLVLAFVVAFGSLTFTIAAIVAAPQVAAFLGLTFHAGGLDRARGDSDAPPHGFRWVTWAMLGSMVLLAALAVLGLPAVLAGP